MWSTALYPNGLKLSYSDDGDAARGRVTLFCLGCGNAKREDRGGAPPDTARIETEVCDLCDDGGGFPTEHYFALDGRELEPL